MLVNLSSEITSQFHTDIEKMYWVNDPTHLKWLKKRKDFEKEFIQVIPNFKGIHLSDLNPHLWLTNKFDYDDSPFYVELPKRDKRNRKLNKMLGQGYSQFWQYPYKESKTKFSFTWLSLKASLIKGSLC